MNKKQKICLWMGLGVIDVVGLFTLGERYDDYGWGATDFLILLILIAITTFTVFLHCKSEKKKGEQKNERKSPVNLKRGLRRLVFVLAIPTSILCACLSLGTVQSEYAYAQYKLESAKQGLQHCEDWRIANSWLYNLNLPEVGVTPHQKKLIAAKNQNIYEMNMYQRSLIEAKENNWLKLSNSEVNALSIAALLRGAIAGYVGIWALWFGGIAIYKVGSKFISWLALGFRDDMAEQVGEVEQTLEHESENLEKENPVAEQAPVG